MIGLIKIKAINGKFYDAFDDSNGFKLQIG